MLEQYRDRFRYILVDEYQDTNQSQYAWLKLLAEPRRNLCCVGDDDQSIYSWRGAEVANILRFEKDFPGAKVIRLEQNYRSTSHILAAADGLIANNAGRLGKTLWTDKGDGEKVRVVGIWDGPEEARRIGEDVEGIQRRGAQPRRRRHPRPRPVPDPRVRRALHRDRPALPDHRRLSLLRARRDPRRPRLPPPHPPARRRPRVRAHRQPAQARPRRQGGRHHPRARARNSGAVADRRLRLLDTDELQSRARSSLGRFVADIARWRQMANELPHAELARIMLDESGYTAMLQAERSAESAGRLENLAELTRAMEEYETLPAFLEHVSAWSWTMTRTGRARRSPS